MPYENLRSSLAYEFCGTFILVTSAALTSVYTHILGMDPFRVHVVIAVVVGLVVAAAILTIGNTSGAHLNPLVSASHAIEGLMPRRLLLPYIASQLLAAVASGIVLSLVCRSIHSPQYGLTELQEGTTPLSGIVLEVVGTFALCNIALIASTRFKDKTTKQALIVGVILFMLTVGIGPFTGASFNPSRSLGPAVASMDFGYQYVYLVGPAVGALLACLWFSLFFRARGSSSGPNNRPEPTSTVSRD